MSVIEMKKALRRDIKQRQSALNMPYRENADFEIARLLFSTEEYMSSECVFCFVGIDSEIDTSEILTRIIRDGKRLCVPLCVGSGIMEAREIHSRAELISGSYGIPEPKKSSLSVDITSIDLAVVPCLSCSHSGKRLGHGGGYYDRFLDGFMGKSVMLCYEKLIRENIPLEEHDKIILPVITECGVFR